VFIGLVVYYRVDFATIVSPILALFRKGKMFCLEGQKAMDTLKNKIVAAPVLITLDSPSALPIFFNVGASNIG
jgi:hypothetical protein